MKRRIELRQKMGAAFMVFAVFLLAAMGFLAYYGNRVALQDANVADLLSKADEKEVALTTWIETRKREVSNYAGMPHVAADIALLAAVQEGTPAARAVRDRLAQEFRLFTGKSLLEIFLMAPETGKVIVSTNPDTEGKFKEDRPFFIEGRKGPYLQGPYYSVDLGAPSITVAAPVKSPGGRLLGVMAGRLGMEELGAMMRGEAGRYLTDDWYLVNRSSLFVTQPRFVSNPVILRLGIHTEAVERALNGERGHLLGRDYRNQPTIAVYRWLPAYKLCLIVERDQQEAFEASRAFGRMLILISVVALLAASLLAVWMARRISRPILALREGASRFGRGESDIRLPESGRDEIDDLAREFNRMAEAVSERQAVLKASEERHRNILEAAMDGIWRLDLQGRLLEVNPSYCRMSGYSAQELLTMGVGDLDVAETADETAARIQKIIACGQDRFESRHRRKDGTVFAVEVSVQYHSLEGGSMVAFLHDITERKRAEKERSAIAEIGLLISSTLEIDAVYDRFAAKVKGLISFDNLTINLIDQDQNEILIAYVSGMEIPFRRKGDRIPFKGSMSEQATMSGQPILLQSENLQEIIKEYPARIHVYDAGLRSILNVPLVSKGSVFGVLVFRSLKSNAYAQEDLRLAERIGMQIAGAIANGQLFSNLKQAEEGLAAAMQRFNAHIDNSPLAVIEFDPEQRVIRWSQEATRVFGWRWEEIKGRSISEIRWVHEEDAELVRQELAALMSGIRPRSVNVNRNYRKDGAIICCEWYNSGIYDPQGRLISILSQVLDITDRKKTEEERRALQERLGRSEKMEALGQLAGGVAHDLNNVLGVSTIYSELLQELIAEGDPKRSYVDNILSSNQKAAAIIQDLLTLARRGVTVSQVINLNTIAGNFLRSPEFEKRAALHQNVAFRLECDGELMNVKGSPVHLEKTLMNLVANAAESITGTGEVTIRTQSRYLDSPVGGYDEVSEGDYALLSVSDTGMGIHAENIGRIFEPFYTKKAMGRSGTGLGLAIVWGTVKDHKGYINVETKIGEGTTFTLYFPVTREEPIEEETKAPIERYMGQGESVLVVDDVAEQREVAARLLLRLGYRVHVVSSGEEAVEYLKENRMDILLLDMIMAPGIDGLETYKRILEIHPRQRAIVVSGFSETERVKAAQKLGAGAYVRKPYMMEKIGMAVREELQRVRDGQKEEGNGAGGAPI